MSKTLAYIRVSKDSQDVKNQRHAILEFANAHKLAIDEFIEIEISSRKNSRQRRIDELKDKLESGDAVIVSEITRLGRSTGEIIMLVNDLVDYGVRVRVIKEKLDIHKGSRDIATKVMVTQFALFAEIERDLISLRTKEALAAKKAQGVQLGKPKGTIQKSIYDKDRKRIEELLQLGVPQKRILENHLGYGSTTSFNYYIKTRQLKTEPEPKTIKVELWLQVENNNKFVRGKKKAREDIERFVLSHYDYEKPDPKGSDYILTIPYKHESEIEDTLYEILRDAEREADTRHCFIEAHAHELGNYDKYFV